MPRNCTPFSVCHESSADFNCPERILHLMLLDLPVVEARKEHAIPMKLISRRAGVSFTVLITLGRVAGIEPGLSSGLAGGSACFLNDALNLGDVLASCAVPEGIVSRIRDVHALVTCPTKNERTKLVWRTVISYGCRALRALTVRDRCQIGFFFELGHMIEIRDIVRDLHGFIQDFAGNMLTIIEDEGETQKLDNSIRTEAVGASGRQDLPGIRVSAADWNIRRLHVVPTGLPVSRLQCTEAWNSLTDSQRHFVHHLGRASWSGARICAHQLSKESPDILRMLLLLLSSADLEDLKRRSEGEGVAVKEWEYFIAYATCFLTNLGNYLAFGDLKTVPGIAEEKFDAIVKICPLQGQKKQRLVSLWEKTRARIYSLLPGERFLGFQPDNCTAYYSEDIRLEEVKLVSEWMKQESIEPWNTRIWRRESSGNYGSLPEYDLRIASALEFPVKTYVYQNKCVINVVYGDFQEDLKEVVRHLKRSLPYAESSVHREMVNGFIEYLEIGSIDSHKKCQEIWLNNQNNYFIEFHLGFIETYRDPGGCRAEFEGFVGCVNEVATKQFATLIAKADVLLPLLPWPKDYEADKFRCPDFTCIEVFAYANGTIPAGINLPNYESVRQTHGSRTFCLSNVVESHDSNSKITFLEERDNELYERTKRDVFIMQLAFHELLGHGSGKLFTQDSEGDYNFPRGTVMHPFTDEAVVTCYGPGETWNSVFGQISAPFEECRAESVGLFLSAYPEALKVFGHEGERGEDVMYINWLMMARAGLLALEYFTESGDWRQAHMQGRFGILRTLLDASAREAENNGGRGVESGKNFLQILPCGRDKLVLYLNRDKIKTVGMPAIRDLLVKLQVYKSTADVQRGRSMFTELTTVPKELLQLRSTVLANKRPWPMFVQMNTKMVESNSGSKILMEEFDLTQEGLIQSYVTRFQDWIGN